MLSRGKAYLFSREARFPEGVLGTRRAVEEATGEAGNRAFSRYLCAPGSLTSVIHSRGMWCGNVRRAEGGGGLVGEGGQTVRRRHEAVEVARVTENTKRCDRRVVSARFVDSLRAFPPREEVVRMLRHVWPAQLVASALRAVEWPTPILFAALTRGSCVSPFLLRLLYVLLIIRASFHPFLGLPIFIDWSFVFQRANSFSTREFDFSRHMVNGVSEFC